MIAIYLNSTEWGGVDMIVERYSKYLKNKRVEFIVIDKKGSRFRKENPSVDCIEIEQLNKYADQVDYLFLPSVSKLRDIEKMMAISRAKIFTWVVHPNDVFRTYFPFSGKLLDSIGYSSVQILRNIFRKHTAIFDYYFKTLVNSKAIVVMDGATLRSFHFFLPNLRESPKIIPIPTSVDNIPIIQNAVSENGKLLIGYLGRLDGFKWSAIKPFIKSTLFPLSNKIQISFHVVSEGKHINDMREMCENSGIEFVHYGYLPNTKAKKILIENTMLCVAMGTSALDLASHGQPVVILDPSIGWFAKKQKAFNFVHEVQDFTVGEYRNSPGYIEGKLSFNDVMKRISEPDMRIHCAEIIRCKHGEDKVFDKIMMAMEESTICVNDLVKLTRQLLNSFQACKVGLSIKI